MSKRVLGLATIFIALIILCAAFWPKSTSKETINSPAPRAPAAIPKKLDRILPVHTGGKAAIRLPPPVERSGEAQARQESLVERFRIGRGRGVSVADERFEVLRLKAIPAAQYRPELGEKIGERMGFAIFASRDASGEFTNDGTFPVVAKKSNGMLGIVTGTIVVRLKESSLALSLADTYEMTLKYIDDDLRIAYYSAAGKTSLTQLVDLLARDTAVESVNLEIVNSKKRN